MKKAKSALVAGLAVLMAASVFTGCSGSSSSKGSSSEAKAKEIYFLNFKPEIAEKYKAIATEYEQKTGVKVKVVTAANNTYEQVLRSEVAKTDAPTIFQINGPNGYTQWKKYCADISDSQIYKNLSDQKLAVKDGSGIYGVPYLIEGYGIIYNDAIMKKYFALSNKKTTISATTDIKSYATLKAVADDMQANKDALGIKGAFACTSLTKGQDWRWQTHLFSVPMYYEFKDKASNASTITTGVNAKNFDFKYADNYKNLLDLYMTDSTTDKKLLGSKSVADSMAEFALGQAAMVQNGEWAWGDISKVAGMTVKKEDIHMLPIYMGNKGEDKQGICIGTENYFSINKQVSKAKQKASLDFLNWLFSSSEGKAHVKNDLGFIAPFKTFNDSEKPDDPLAKEVLKWSADTKVTNLEWSFQSIPDQAFKDAFGADLLQYAQGAETWDKVVAGVKDNWTKEQAAIASSKAS